MNETNPQNYKMQFIEGVDNDVLILEGRDDRLLILTAMRLYIAREEYRTFPYLLGDESDIPSLKRQFSSAVDLYIDLENAEYGEYGGEISHEDSGEIIDKIVDGLSWMDPRK